MQTIVYIGQILTLQPRCLVLYSVIFQKSRLIQTPKHCRAANCRLIQTPKHRRAANRRLIQTIKYRRAANRKLIQTIKYRRAADRRPIHIANHRRAAYLPLFIHLVVQVLHPHVAVCDDI